VGRWTQTEPRRGGKKAVFTRSEREETYIYPAEKGKEVGSAAIPARQHSGHQRGLGDGANCRGVVLALEGGKEHRQEQGEKGQGIHKSFRSAEVDQALVRECKETERDWTERCSH